MFRYDIGFRDELEGQGCQSVTLVIYFHYYEAATFQDVGLFRSPMLANAGLHPSIRSWLPLHASLTQP